MGLIYEDEVVAATLAWCNERRAEKGEPPLDELPKGEREDPESCPCGAATGLYVEHYTYGEGPAERWANDLPTLVKEFVVGFDADEYPQFDLHAARVRRWLRRG